MQRVKLSLQTKFARSERIQALQKRSQELALAGKRKLSGGWTGNLEGRVYGWTGETYTPQPGDEPVDLGDHACWIDIGPFPNLQDVPSRRDGYAMNGESWGRDYAYLLDQTPPAIHPLERIVGEIYWRMGQVRRYNWADTGEEVFDLGRQARALGCGGMSSGHTCPDLGIGLELGFGGILNRIQQYRKLYERLDNQRKASYLRGLEAVCLASIRFIERYAKLAAECRHEAMDLEEQARYLAIQQCCERIASQPPSSFYEAVQWIMFAVLFDRSVGHGNGYGRLDLYLIEFYRQDLATGKLTRELAREYLSEMYLKLRGHFFSVGGRLQDMTDATNEMSWVVLEAYDMIGDYNNLGVMWHSDMEPQFYAYACDVMARHGESIPVLVNYDLMYESELRSGIPHEHAWTVAYSGCQWFCIPGREYCEQDVNSFVAIDPMKRALQRAAESCVTDFSALYAMFAEETRRTAKAFRNLKRGHDEYLGDIWPEMFTSLLCHGPIERGLDCVAPRGVDYQFTSVNILGVPNASDSFYAIKRLVFEEGRYALSDVIRACNRDWQGDEIMRQRFLKQGKYGNDLDGPDQMFASVAETIADALGSLYNQKGQEFRPSLFHFQGHTAPTVIGATPDGRRAKDYLAHGVNPTLGMNENGLIPTANSLARADLRKFQGAPLQVDLQPKFFDGKEEIWRYIRDFSVAFFNQGGMQVNLHILDLNHLRQAMEHPDDPAYRNIVVRVTGYCARFVTLSREFQEEFVARNNYDSM